MSRRAGHSSESEALDSFQACLDFPSLLKGGRIAAHWMADGRFWFVEGAPESTCIKVFDVRTGACDPLFDMERVRRGLRALIGRDPPYKGLPFDTFVQAPDGEAVFSFEGDDYRLSRSGEVSRALKPSGIELATARDRKSRTTPRSFLQSSYFHGVFPATEVLSPDGRWFAGIRDFNLYLRPSG